MDTYRSPMPGRARRSSHPWVLVLGALLVVGALLVAEQVARTPPSGTHYVAGITAAVSGDWIAYRTATDQNDQRLYAMNRLTRDTSLVYTSAEIGDMALSPDGSRLIFLAGDGSGNRAYVYDTGSGSDPQLCSPAAALTERVAETEPVAVDWLSDGRAVLECAGAGRKALFAYSPADGRVEVLARAITSGSNRLFCPHSAAKPRVYLQPDVDPSESVSYLDEQSGTVVPATRPEVPGWGLVSPDGTRVLVNTGAGYTIAPTVEAGGGPQVAVDAPAGTFCADWSPSGALVAIGASIVSAADGRRKTALAAVRSPEDVWFSGDDHVIVLMDGRLVLVDIRSGRSTTLVAPSPRAGGVARTAENLRHWLGMF